VRDLPSGIVLVDVFFLVGERSFVFRWQSFGDSNSHNAPEIIG
jgi:hypothetical protein